MKTDGIWIKDSDGRVLILHGVNLSGSTKVPFTPDGATHKLKSLQKPEKVSFIGRPFPLDEADEHFLRLRNWGLTFVRFLITWEAVEHKGPGIYDNDYLDYLEKIIIKASEYDINVFIDPHNDVWSRWTGGDGAPAWTMEQLGMNTSNMHEIGAAVVHAYYKGSLPNMIWVSNHHKLGAQTMFTLFFGGNDFAPQTKIEGEPVQEVLQSHYIGTIKQVAKRLRNYKNVCGFETMNEPNTGYIGYKNLKKLAPYPLRIGAYPTPYKAMLLASGYSLKIPLYTRYGFISIPKKKLLNPQKKKLWKDGYECIWKENGIWTDNREKPILLKPHHFYTYHNRKVDFEDDYLKPFMCRFYKEIKAIQPKTMIFLNGVPDRKMVKWSFSDGENVVNAPHWYDVKTLLFKKFNPHFTINPENMLPVFSKKNVQNSYTSQLTEIKQTSLERMGSIPILIGEFGLPFNLNNNKSYKQNIFEKQTYALNAYYNAMDANLLNCTLWNYTPDNTNVYGDNWNEEDLSIFSKDQQDEPENINSGGRAIAGFSRPYARKIAGIPIFMSFDLKTRTFTFHFKSNPDLKAPTEIFIPPYQYPQGTCVKVKEGEFEKDEKNFIIRIYTNSNDICEIVIKPRL